MIKARHSLPLALTLAAFTAGLAGVLTGLPYLLGWLLSVNMLVILLMAKDKSTAIRNNGHTGKGRTPEKTLLMLGASGGSPALIAAMHLFGHKRAKQQFSTAAYAIITLQVIAAIYFRNELLTLASFR